MAQIGTLKIQKQCQRKGCTSSNPFAVTIFMNDDTLGNSTIIFTCEEHTKEMEKNVKENGYEFSLTS